MNASGHAEPDSGVEHSADHLVVVISGAGPRAAITAVGQGNSEATSRISRLGAYEADFDAAYAGEQVMVVDPDGGDVQERREVGDVPGPLVGEFVSELASGGVRMKIQDQQGQSDGQDAVGEGLDAVTLAYHASRVAHHWSLGQDGDGRPQRDERRAAQGAASRLRPGHDQERYAPKSALQSRR